MHREVGEAARAAGALLLTAGERSAAMGGEHFASKAELISALPRLLKRGDRVLVKASHSMPSRRSATRCAHCRCNERSKCTVRTAAEGRYWLNFNKLAEC